MRTLPSALLLLALASTGFAAYGAPEAPTRFLRVELLDIGAMTQIGRMDGYTRALRLDYEFNHWRVGLAALDQRQVIDGADGSMSMTGFLVPDVGYLIYRQPKRTAFFYGMVPSLWAEAAAVIPVWLNDLHAAARVDCRAEVDYYGVGLGAELGVEGGYAESGPFLLSYLRLGVILGVANFGF
jgi:hypothetical protein